MTWNGPAIRICTFCNRQVKVPTIARKRVADAQETQRLQFAAHKCGREQTSVPDVREAIENK